MYRVFRNLTVLALAAVAITAVPAQTTSGDDGPDIFAKLRAVNVYMEDGGAIIVAQACAETEPDFMPRFLLAFSAWRVANAQLISLGANLSAQFKDSRGEPMDPTQLGHAAAEKLRAASPEERHEACAKVFKELGSAK